MTGLGRVNIAGDGENGTPELRDLNGDGRSDLIRTWIDSAGAITKQTVRFGQFNGDFSAPLTSETKDGTQSLGEAGSGDVNGDGLADAVFLGADGKLRIAVANASTGRFSDIVTASVPLSGGHIKASSAGDDIFWGDIDGNGQLDVVFVGKTGSRDVWSYTVNQSTAATWMYCITGGSETGAPELRDVNGDGRSDLIRTQVDSTQQVTSATVQFGKSDKTFSTPLASVLVNGDAWLGETIYADVDGSVDGLADAVYRNTVNQLVVSRRTSTGAYADPVTFTPTNGVGTDAANWELLLGDINGDGRSDAVFVATNGTRDATWFLGQAKPASGAWTPFVYKGTLGGGSQDAELADINDDGYADLTRLVSTGTDGTTTRSVRWGATTGMFSASSTTVLSKSLQGTAGADTLTGVANQVNFLFGDGGNDTLSGSSWSDTLDGGAGDDTLSGGVGSDTYAFGVGSGVDRITDTGGRADILAFSSGVTLSDLVLDLGSAADLRLGLGTTSNRTLSAATDKVTLVGYKTATDKPIEKLSFADGSQIDLQRLVQAMGAFKSATTGEVDLKRPDALKVAAQLLVPSAFRTVA